MRRGLMSWNADELPKHVLEERLARLRASMQREGLDGFLFYTNLVQPSAVTWLTGFTPYWSDGILLVGRDGAPVFATALSKRVANWIRSTNAVSEIVNTPKPGTAVGQRLAAGACKRVGVLELDDLPAGLDQEIVGAAPGIDLTDASAVFALARRRVDSAERDLIARADAIAVAAIDQVDAAHAGDAGATAGLVEKHARLAGAEEAYIAVAPDLDTDRRLIRVSKPVPLGGRFAVRASVAYKGSWVRRMRTFAKDDAGRQAVARADKWFGRVVSSLEPGTPVAAQLRTQLKDLAAAELRNWLAESCIGSDPLDVVAAARSPDFAAPVAGTFLVLTVELAVDGVPWLGAAPAFVGAPSC